MADLPIPLNPSERVLLDSESVYPRTSLLGLGYNAIFGHLWLTNQRLVHHYGILTRVTNRIEVIDIDDIKFTQNILERILGVGTIQILSTDVSDPKLVIRGIDDVKRVFALMDDARRDERRKRGMYIETV